MRWRGFLAIILISAAVIYFLWMLKAGKDKVVEDVETFSQTHIELTKANMSSLANMIQSFSLQTGRTPDSLQEFQKFYRMPVSSQDVWGTSIRYERISDDKFRLISAGPDKTFTTTDDISLDF